MLSAVEPTSFSKRHWSYWPPAVLLVPVLEVAVVVLLPPVELACSQVAVMQFVVAVSVAPCVAVWQAVGVALSYCGSVLQSQEAGSQSFSLGWWALCRGGSAGTDSRCRPDRWRKV